MKELIAKVETASGPDHELDARIWVALHQPDYRFPDEVLNRRPADYREAVNRFTHDGCGGGSTDRKSVV